MAFTIYTSTLSFSECVKQKLKIHRRWVIDLRHNAMHKFMHLLSLKCHLFHDKNKHAVSDAVVNIYVYINVKHLLAVDEDGVCTMGVHSFLGHIRR